MSCRPLALLPLALMLGVPASAQVSGSLDLGAGTYRPERSIPGGIASIAPTLRFRTGRLELEGGGVYSDAPAGRWNFQGTGAGLLRTPQMGVFQGELAGEFDWTNHYQTRGTTALRGTIRGYVSPLTGTRVWLGMGLGTATSLGRRRELERSEIGGSAQVGGVQLGLSVLRTSFRLVSDPSWTGLGDTASIAAPEHQYADSAYRNWRFALTDVVLSGQWRVASLRFEASIGRRFSQSTPEITIWGLSTTRPITPTVALVAAAGRAGSDPVTSVPGARYFALGVRLTTGGSRATPLVSLPPSGDETPFRVGPPAATGREVLVRAPHARVVELAGDFTDWRPVRLERRDPESWRVVLPIPPGLHRMALRIDGGRWRAPPGTRAITNEFGGEVAEIVIE